jgi:hypothetical protein
VLPSTLADDGEEERSQLLIDQTSGVPFQVENWVKAGFDEMAFTDKEDAIIRESIKKVRNKTTSEDLEKMTYIAVACAIGLPTN